MIYICFMNCKDIIKEINSINITPFDSYYLNEYSVGIVDIGYFTIVRYNKVLFFPRRYAIYRYSKEIYLSNDEIQKIYNNSLNRIENESRKFSSLC